MDQVTVSKRLTFWNRSLLYHGVGKVAGTLLQKKQYFYFSDAALSDLQHCFKNHRNKQTGLAFKVGLIEDKVAKCRNTLILLH